MSDIFDKLLLLYIVFQVVTAIYRGLRGGEEASEEFAGQPDLEGLPDETFHFMIQESLSQLSQAERDIRALQKRIAPLIRTRFPQGPVYDLLREHLRTEVNPKLNDIQATLDDAQEMLETQGELATVSYLNRSDVIANAFKTLAQLWETVGAVESLLLHQQTSESRDLLRMAEMIGQDLVQSWNAHITPSGGHTEPPSVVALVAPTDDISLPNGLLKNHLVVTVPVDALAEPQSWLRVVQSTAKAFLKHHHPLFAQLSGGLGEANTAWLPRRQGRNIVVDTRSMFGAWRATILADTLGTLSLGPAYVHGLYRALENPGDPSSVMDAPTSPDGQTFGSSPPSHLRIMLCCEVLQDLGFTHAASELRRAWFLAHGESGGMWTETMWGQYLQVPWDQLFTVGGELVRHAVNTPLPSLNRQSLRELHGATMSPERWHEVEALLSAWISNEDHGGRATSCLSALLLGMVEHESRQMQLLARMQRALFKQISTSPRFETVDSDANNVRRPITQIECLEAMILRNILIPKYRPKHPGQPQRI